MITIEVNPEVFDKWKRKLTDYSDQITYLDHEGSHWVTLRNLEMALKFMELIQESRIVCHIVELDQLRRLLECLSKKN